MPTYDFQCTNCQKTYELKMTMAEHSEQKDRLTCQECHSPLSQSVAPLRFALKGSGWFADGSGNNSNGTGYGITQREMDRNGEITAGMEDAMMNAPKESE